MEVGDVFKSPCTEINNLMYILIKHLIFSKNQIGISREKHSEISQ